MRTGNRGGPGGIIGRRHLDNIAADQIDPRQIAPMPGLITAVKIETGSAVKSGEPLIIMEAMKMEHTLKAPRDGIVAEITVSAGDQVEDGTILLVLEEAVHSD